MIWDIAEVKNTESLAGENYRLTFFQPEFVALAKPGQFVEISTQGASLLNKPISICNIDKCQNLFQVVFKVVGPGTKALSEFKVGAKIKVAGPCGNGYEPIVGPACLIGGGIGIPPMYYLAKENQSHAELNVILGARTCTDLVLENEFKALKLNLKIATDDGSKGHRGTVVDVLGEVFKHKALPVYACGPLPMLASIARATAIADVPFYACLESYMGCGFGICMGCAIPTIRGMERVCKEGPVFLGSDVLWQDF